ncbi:MULTISPECIES: SDR family oxidoreductase [Streptomyces]|uniref:SDR family oxidoreductase n=2 Tax=Streptomyces TaxID=1883 RepID=A0A3R7J2Y1_9ACTN|nr:MULTISPECIES: SDR family oxidoreductase [Streptomyces]KNE82847.1 oxidoreductase [Streptomyces fradiae]OFA51948.1 oxidoreductase [Streptomyces fradiae]PQM23322.1 SDR family NAD(P)-dependent oxidoreductase [Streptomyces xinghaiensis]RKM94886.1 SDR family oxidoreductase [Streptomyces xinghaiensis]RNC74675.1 SDR family oxidoreductase [Streptomyces xinghaiensis]
MLSLHGKTVAITGASGGIGEATARLLARRGAAVVLAARRRERIDAIAEDIREEEGCAAACVVDVTKADDLRRLVSSTVDRYGRIDVLVNNAGIAPIGPLADLDIDNWSAMIDVNLRGMLNGVAAALPVFREQGAGHLVSIVSVAGLSVSPSMAVYAATKNAVRTVHEGLRAESTDGVVRTTAISPGYVRTDLADSMADPDIRERTRKTMDAMGIPPDAVARAVAFAVEQPGDVEIGEINVRPTAQA